MCVRLCGIEIDSYLTAWHGSSIELTRRSSSLFGLSFSRWRALQVFFLSLFKSSLSPLRHLLDLQLLEVHQSLFILTLFYLRKYIQVSTFKLTFPYWYISKSSCSLTFPRKYSYTSASRTIFKKNLIHLFAWIYTWKRLPSHFYRHISSS